MLLPHDTWASSHRATLYTVYSMSASWHTPNLYYFEHREERRHASYHEASMILISAAGGALLHHHATRWPPPYTAIRIGWLMLHRPFGGLLPPQGGMPASVYAADIICAASSRRHTRRATYKR